MTSRKTWIILGALIAALLGAAPAAAGVAIDNAVVLDPYDPVPSIGFTHWYGGCERACGCEESCYRRVRCDEGCYRDRCDRDCGRCHEGCERDACEGGCVRERCDHDCGCAERGCGVQVALPCTTGDCDERLRWEHTFRDGNHIVDEWYDHGKHEGTRERHFHHRFDDDDDGDQDGPR